MLTTTTNNEDIISELRSHCEKYIDIRLKDEVPDNDWLVQTSKIALRLIYGDKIFDKLAAIDRLNMMSKKSLSYLSSLDAENPIGVGIWNIECADFIAIGNLVHFDETTKKWSPSKLGKLVLQAFYHGNNIKEFLITKDHNDKGVELSKDTKEIIFTAAFIGETPCPFNKGVIVGDDYCINCKDRDGSGKDENGRIFIICMGVHYE